MRGKVFLLGLVCWRGDQGRMVGSLAARGAGHGEVGEELLARGSEGPGLGQQRLQRPDAVPDVIETLLALGDIALGQPRAGPVRQVGGGPQLSRPAPKNSRIYNLS